MEKFALVWWEVGSYGDYEVYETFETREAAEAAAIRWWGTTIENLEEDGYKPRLLPIDQVTVYMTKA